MNNRIFQLSMNLIILLICFPIHECAHAWMAKQLGDSTGAREGRISLNPLVHIDWFGALCMILLGFGWAKPVPINPNNFKNPKRDFAISALAGPFANLLMAFIAILIAKTFVAASYASVQNVYYLRLSAQIFYYVMVINLSLALFNLLPVPPLDGSRIYAAMLPESTYFKIMRYENIFFIGLIIISFTGILDGPFAAMQSAAINIMDFLTCWMDIILRKIFVLG